MKVDLNSSSDTMDLINDAVFLKLKAIENDRIQITLWDYRFTDPIHVGMIMNMQGEDFDLFTLNWAIISLTVNLANYTMKIANLN